MERRFIFASLSHCINNYLSSSWSWPPSYLFLDSPSLFYPIHESPVFLRPILLLKSSVSYFEHPNDITSNQLKRLQGSSWKLCKWICFSATLLVTFTNDIFISFNSNPCVILQLSVSTTHPREFWFRSYFLLKLIGVRNAISFIHFIKPTWWQNPDSDHCLVSLKQCLV